MGLSLVSSGLLVLPGLLFALALPGAARAETPEARAVVRQANERWEAASDFQAGLEIKLQLFGTSLTVPGRCWQKGPLIRMDFEVPARFLQGAADPAATERVMMTYDGNVFWQLMPMAGVQWVRRIDYARLEQELGARPAMPSLRLPDLPYQLEEREKDGERFHYLSTPEADRLTDALLFPGTTLGVSLQPVTGAAIWLDRQTLFPRLVDFYGDREEIVRQIRFYDIRVDQGLDAGHFAFQAPADARVMDWTAILLRQYRAAETQAAPPPPPAPER